MQGLLLITDPSMLLWVVIGTSLGILVGGIPGLTGAMLIALALPMTFSMEGTEALALLVSMYVGSVSGGLVSATLLRIPGTPASIVTTLDGYPMAQSGRAGRALGLGITASLVGGLISWGVLVLLARPLAGWSTRMGPFEMFSLVCMALVLIVAVSRGSIAAGLLSGLLGILASMPGTIPGSGELRLTFGAAAMNDGFKLLPVLIGLFAFNEVLRGACQAGDEQASSRNPGGGAWSWRSAFLKPSEWKGQIVNLLRSSAVGTFVGILPGVGANVGSILSYSAAKNLSKAPEKFGTGCDEGVVAAEASNNATVGGALVPLVALGIPGSVIDAILLGAFVIHGLQPGPMLFVNDPEVVHAITGSYFWANIAMAFLMLISIRGMVRLAAIPKHLLLPLILIFCVLGSYALANRFFDVWVMIGFGLLGYFLERCRIPLAPFVIGFVLAPLAEENLYAGLMQSGGNYAPILTRPISLTFVLLGLMMLGFSVVRKTGRGSTDRV
jgi:putative tricarboxylic transport membrane protein